MNRILVIVVSVVGLSWCGSNPVAGQDEESRKEDSARVNYLIGMLASKNREPKVQGDAGRGEDETIDFPKKYDKSLQVSVFLAVQQLLAEGEKAIDPLLNHGNDQRYSFSVNSSNDHNVSVSEACEMIATEILLPFNSELNFITQDQGEVYPSDRTDLPFKKWWEENKRRGLRTLQIEAIDKMIAFMKTVDGKTASLTHASYVKRRPVAEFDRLREENLKILDSIRRTITERSEPYRPKSLDNHHRYVFGLPWTLRRFNL